MSKKLTRKLIAMGIKSICPFPNTNGAYPCVVQTSKLATDHNCRDLDKSHAKKMFDDFWIQAMTNLTVYALDGKLQVMDGQTRLEVGRLKDMEELTCDVQFDKELKDALEMFWRENSGRKNMNKNSNIRAAFDAGIIYYVDFINKIHAEKYTCRVTKGFRGNKVRCDFTNLNALTEMYGNGDLERGLKCLKAWYKDGQLDKVATNCSFLRGLRNLLKKNKLLSVNEFVDCFTDISAIIVYRRAVSLAGGTDKRVDAGHFEKALEFYFAQFLKKAA